MVVGVEAGRKEREVYRFIVRGGRIVIEERTNYSGKKGYIGPKCKREGAKKVRDNKGRGMIRDEGEG